MTRKDQIIRRLIILGYTHRRVYRHYEAFSIDTSGESYFVGRNGALRRGATVAHSTVAVDGNFEHTIALLNHAIRRMPGHLHSYSEQICICGEAMPHDGDLDLRETPSRVILVAGMICETCEYRGEQTEFLPRAGTATVKNPPRCPQCKSEKLTRGEVERKLAPTTGKTMQR